MNSKLIKLYDYREVPLPEIVWVEGLKEKMQEEICHLCRKFKKTEKSDTVEAGDIVTLDSQSGRPKFNRKGLKLNVGRKLFDGEYEERLIGLRVGETARFTVGDDEVEVTVLESKRTVYPELTDEIVAEGMLREEYNEPDIKTVEQYLPRLHDDCAEVLIEEAQDDRMNELLKTVIAKSEWKYDDEELASLLKEQMAGIEEELKEEGKSLDTMSEQEYRLAYSGWGMTVSNKKELEESVLELLKESVSAMIIGCVLEGKDYENTEPEDAGGRAYEIFLDYVKEKITFKIKEDE